MRPINLYEQMFGPIASILKVHGEAEALRVANDTQHVLSKPSSHATRSAACHLRWICTPA